MQSISKIAKCPFNHRFDIFQFKVSFFSQCNTVYWENISAASIRRRPTLNTFIKLNLKLNYCREINGKTIPLFTCTMLVKIYQHLLYEYQQSREINSRSVGNSRSVRICRRATDASPAGEIYLAYVYGIVIGCDLVGIDVACDTPGIRIAGYARNYN